MSTYSHASHRTLGGITSQFMPRDSTRSLTYSTTGNHTHVPAVWHTAAIAPRSSRNTPYTLDIPTRAKTPADKLICSLLEDCGMEWGCESRDIRQNITLSVWVDVQKVCPPQANLHLYCVSDRHGLKVETDDSFESHLTHTLKVKLEPGMFIRACIVPLDSFIEGPSIPLWLEWLRDVSSVSPLEFVRMYTWVDVVIREILATPGVSVFYVDSWFSLIDYVGHIKVSMHSRIQTSILD